MEKVFWSYVLNLVKLRRYVRKQGICRVASVAALFACSGCAVFNEKGFETYAKVGFRAVDEHEEKQSTKLKPCGGLRGWWNGCDSQESQTTK